MDNSSLSGQGPSLQQRELALGGGIDGLDGKICVEKIARDGRDGSAGAAVLHDDRHGDLGIVIRCIADENGIVDLVVAELGGAGLGGDLHAVVAEGLIRAAGAVIGDEVHALLHSGPVIVAGLDGAEYLGLIFVNELVPS